MRQPRIYTPSRRGVMIGGGAAAVSLALPHAAGAQSAGVLRIGMTAADIPQMTGSPDNGFEGYRFCGYTLYDALCNWDLSSADQSVRPRPRPRRELGGRPRRQDQVDFQAAPAASTFHDGIAVQCRRGGLESTTSC